MPDQLQLRGGTTAEHTSFTGASKEVTIDTTKKTAVVHDASTAGGNPLMREDGANSALVNGSVTEPALAFAAGDADNGIYSPGADQVAITTNGTERVEWGASEVVFNDGGNNYDFRVEGDTNANLLVVDASADAVGVGTATPVFGTGNGLEIEQNGPATLRLEDSSGNSGVLEIRADDGVSSAIYDARGHSSNRSHVFQLATDEVARIDSSGRLLVGTSEDANAGASNRLVVQGNDDVRFLSTSGYGLELIRQSIPTENQDLGRIVIGAYETGTTEKLAVKIEAEADGDWATGDCPGRLVFFTTPVGGASVVERMRIDSAGDVGIGVNPTRGPLHIHKAGTTNTYLKLTNGFTGSTASDGSEIIVTTAGHLVFNNRENTPINFQIFGSERARIDTSGRLLVGHSSNSGLGSAGAIESQNTAGNNLVGVRYSNNTGGADITMGKSRSDTRGTLSLLSENDTMGALGWRGAKDGGWRLSGDIQMRVAAGFDNDDSYCPGYMVFRTSPGGSTAPQERMRIRDNGIVLIGTTTNDPGGFTSGGGVSLSNDGSHFARASATVIYANRSADDGTVIQIRQGGTQEGTISVSGTTVSYNGGHLARWSQLPGGVERTEILRGSVLSNIDEMCEWGDEDNEQLNRMKVSDVEGDKNVAGVFQCWDDDDDTYTNDFYCAMTGDFVIRIAQGVTVERGDLLMSAGDGTAKPQDDDIIRSKTIAKVTSTNVSCTYDDGSYCVPCVLMAC